MLSIGAPIQRFGSVLDYSLYSIIFLCQHRSNGFQRCICVDDEGLIKIRVLQAWGLGHSSLQGTEGLDFRRCERAKGATRLGADKEVSQRSLYVAKAWDKAMIPSDGAEESLEILAAGG